MVGESVARPEPTREFRTFGEVSGQVTLGDPGPLQPRDLMPHLSKRRSPYRTIVSPSGAALGLTAYDVPGGTPRSAGT